MKSATSQLAAHLAGETTTLATCWKVTRRDGEVFGFTDHDFDLTVEGEVYEARTGYTRSAVHAISDLSVDKLDIESALDSETLSFSHDDRRKKRSPDYCCGPAERLSDKEQRLLAFVVTRAAAAHVP